MSTETIFANAQRARLTRQGQITVPKAVRDALGARPGDDIEFIPRGTDLLVEVRPRRSLLDFAGIAADAVARVPGDAEDLDALIDAGMTDAAVRRADATAANMASNQTAITPALTMPRHQSAGK